MVCPSNMKSILVRPYSEMGKSKQRNSGYLNGPQMRYSAIVFAIVNSNINTGPARSRAIVTARAKC